MAKKAKHSRLSAPPKPAEIPLTQTPAFLDRDSIPLLVACLLYFAVHFIPDMGGYDAMGAQWFYLVVLDFVVTLYIMSKKQDYQTGANRLFGLNFSKIYLAYFLLAGLSVFQAINPTEGWVCYVRLIATIVAFFNISLLLNGRLDLIKVLAQILAFILLIESIQSLSRFLKEIETMDLSTAILGIKGTTGNKNIFAASTVVKIPFVIYCIYTSKIWWRIVNIVILAIGTFTLFLGNARASFVSLILILLLYIIYCIHTQIKERKTELTLYRLAYVLIPVLIAFFVSLIEISNIKNQQEIKGSGGYGTVTDRLASSVAFNADDNQVRIHLWEHAIDYTQKHPLMGCGYGNWKIASIPYQRTLTNNLIVPVHSHNDYLENFAELGLAGGIFYLGLFICIIVYTWKTIFSPASEERKMIAVFSFMAFIGYSVDAFFNFPGERPISQLFFVFITAVNIQAYLPEEKESAETETTHVIKPAFGFVSLLLLLPSMYVTYLTYQSLVMQRSVMADLNYEPMRLDWKTVFAGFPSIPNLCATGQPIEAIKGRYLSEQGRYEEAMKLMDEGRKANPVIGYTEFLKAGAYFKMGQYDSARRNALAAYKMRPRADTYYQTLIAVLAKLKDTANIHKAFNEYNTYRPSVFGWSYFLIGMLNSEGKGSPELLKLADSSLKVFPGDSTLLFRRNEILRFMSAPNTNTGKTVDFALAQRYSNEAVQAFGSGVAGKDDLAKAAGLFLKAAA
ncbi:MAG: O-antigen ligase family protein, partial [Bacteroidota bacterium]|nr:O-antigen ligase family protein [Bacteroidota bacterium]